MMEESKRDSGASEPGLKLALVAAAEQAREASMSPSGGGLRNPLKP
jgi:hypothetical protein